MAEKVKIIDVKDGSYYVTDTVAQNYVTEIYTYIGHFNNDLIPPIQQKIQNISNRLVVVENKIRNLNA